MKNQIRNLLNPERSKLWPVGQIRPAKHWYENTSNVPSFRFVLCSLQYTFSDRWDSNLSQEKVGYIVDRWIRLWLGAICVTDTS